jgi:hypothetical protein
MSAEREAQALRKGDRVVVRRPNMRAGYDPYRGREGVVEFLDGHTSLNVRVSFPEGANWFSEGELELVEGCAQ